MKIHKIPRGPIGANSYIIETDARSMLIDPCVHFDELMQLASPITHIFITHCHYDHVACLTEIKEKTGAVVYSHELEFPSFSDPSKNGSMFFMREDTYTKPDMSIKDGEIIDIDDEIKLECIHTPGHTMGSICLALYEKGICTACFTGDTLFKGTAGRTDLGGSPKMLDESLKKLKNLDDSVKIFCGHGPDSTIGREKLNNPFM